MTICNSISIYNNTILFMIILQNSKIMCGAKPTVPLQ